MEPETRVPPPTLWAGACTHRAHSDSSAKPSSKGIRSMPEQEGRSAPPRSACRRAVIGDIGGSPRPVKPPKTAIPRGGGWKKARISASFPAPSPMPLHPRWISLAFVTLRKNDSRPAPGPGQGRDGDPPLYPHNRRILDPQGRLAVKSKANRGRGRLAGLTVARAVPTGAPLENGCGAAPLVPEPSTPGTPHVVPPRYTVFG